MHTALIFSIFGFDDLATIEMSIIVSAVKVREAKHKRNDCGAELVLCHISVFVVLYGNNDVIMHPSTCFHDYSSSTCASAGGP
jgi:hypothetical protein